MTSAPGYVEPTTPRATRAAEPAGADDPVLRRPVAILVSRFPLITETFILRELIELERQGQPVELVRLVRERPTVRHQEADVWSARAVDAPWLSAAVVAANVRALWRRPGRYLGTLGRVLAGTAVSPSFLVRSAALFPKAVSIAERLQERGVGHLHAHFATHATTLAFVVSRLTDIPFSFTAHAHDIFVNRTLLARKIQDASFVRVISEFNRRFLADALPTLDLGKVTVIPVGVAVPASRPEQVEPVRVLSVAALRPYKGIPVLVHACERLRSLGIDVACDVVGDGPMRAAIARQIASAGLEGQVRLLGARPQHEVAELIARASVVVLPSVVASDGQMDGIPVCLMEAMAAGKPVVGSRLSGIPELVEPGVTGLLVPPGDADQLASALREVLTRPDLAERLGRQARAAVARRFRLDDTVTRLIDRLDRFNDPPVLAALMSNLIAQGLKGRGFVRRVGLRHVRTRPDATVIELAASTGTEVRELILKVQRDRPAQSAPPAERARTEAAALDRLAHHLWHADAGGSGFVRRLDVPSVLHADPERGAILMSRCAGVPLDRRIRDGRRQPGRSAMRDVGSDLRDAGRWLQRFQACASLIGGARVPADGALEGAMRTLRVCEREEVPASDGARIRTALADAWQEMSPDSRRTVPRHGDFWPGNVFVAPGALAVIDFEGLGPGLPFDDAAYFLIHLDFYFAYPLLRRSAARLREAFLQGFAGRHPIDWAACRFHRLSTALELLARSTTGNLAPPLGWRQRMALRDVLRRG